MDRRHFLSATLSATAATTLAGAAAAKANSTTKPDAWRRHSGLDKALNPRPLAVTTGLEEHKPGEMLSESDARHMLRRLGYQATPAELTKAMGMTAKEVIQHLLQSENYATPEAPEWETFEQLTRAELAELSPAEREAYQRMVNQVVQRNRALLQTWWMHKLANSSLDDQSTQEAPVYNPLREKMTFFFHNLYANELAVVNSPVYMHNQNVTFRAHAFGNGKSLARAMVSDPAMLRYLNGNQNTKGRPNENFAREILELFTLGEGNYSEFDIVEAARAFTGWVPGDGLVANLVPARHDYGEKEMFGEKFRFPETVDGGIADTDKVIELIFSQSYADTGTVFDGKHVASVYLARRLYQYFVYQITDDGVIADLADIISANNFDLAPALSTLLSSAHFYDAEFHGAMLKSPLDFLVGIMRQFPMEGVPADYTETVSNGRQRFNIWLLLSVQSPQNSTNSGFSDALGLQLFNPPNVAGWPGHHDWINTATYPLRNGYSDLLTDGILIRSDRPDNPPTVVAQVQALEFGRRYETFESDGDALIEGIARYLLPFDLSEAQHGDLIEALVGSDKSYEWLEKVQDPEQATTGMRNLLKAIMRLPEFQLT